MSLTNDHLAMQVYVRNSNTQRVLQDGSAQRVLRRFDSIINLVGNGDDVPNSALREMNADMLTALATRLIDDANPMQERINHYVRNIQIVINSIQEKCDNPNHYFEAIADAHTAPHLTTRVSECLPKVGRNRNRNTSTRRSRSSSFSNGSSPSLYVYPREELSRPASVAMSAYNYQPTLALSNEAHYFDDDDDL